MILDYLSEKLWVLLFQFLEVVSSNVRAVRFLMMTPLFTFPLVLLMGFVEGLG